MEMIPVAFGSFVAVFTALFPVINPLGDGPIFLNMVQGCSKEVKNRLALSVSIYCFILLLTSMLIGTQLLMFFGISLPALKLAGGAVVIGMGWGLLNQKSSSKGDDDSAGITDANASSNAFFPLTLPLTAGPGSIATSISLVAGYQDGRSLDLFKEMPAVVGSVLALFALSLVIYVIYRESSLIQRALGPAGTNAIMRLFAFILLAIGVQIFIGGVQGFSTEVFSSLHAH